MTSIRETYEAFALAWRRRDVEACLDLMTDDVDNCASIGPEPGTTFKGKEAVRAGISAMLARDDAEAIELSSYTEVDDTAFAEWCYRLNNGKLEYGIDRIDFRGGKIWRKNAYRKMREVG